MIEASMTVTLSVTQRVAIYTEARCPTCSRQIMAVPGSVTLEVRCVPSQQDRAGRGAVVTCKRCQQLREVIVHR